MPCRPPGEGDRSPRHQVQMREGGRVLHGDEPVAGEAEIGGVHVGHGQIARRLADPGRLVDDDGVRVVKEDDPVGAA